MDVAAALWLVHDCKSLNTMASPAFRAFMKLASPQWAVPSASSVVKHEDQEHL